MLSDHERKPILCLDFDGVIHSYTSGWRGADVIPDPPVPGAIAFMKAALDAGWNVQIFSSRSHQPGGAIAMSRWLAAYAGALWKDGEDGSLGLRWVSFPDRKPPAKVTIDDRALLFTGTWPDLDELAAFQPWNKKEKT